MKKDENYVQHQRFLYAVGIDGILLKYVCTSNKNKRDKESCDQSTQSTREKKRL